MRPALGPHALADEMQGAPVPDRVAVQHLSLRAAGQRQKRVLPAIGGERDQIDIGAGRA